MREFNERMVSDERLIGTLLPAYDGLAVAIVK
jgi:caffeoyl-CoA O-methyltransferase